VPPCIENQSIFSECESIHARPRNEWAINALALVRVRESKAKALRLRPNNGIIPFAKKKITPFEEILQLRINIPQNQRISWR
jgi:hypothetical protein